jgi:hypothetical protein
MTKDLEKRYSLVSRTTLLDDPQFNRENYRLRYLHKEDGFLLFSSAHKNGENHLFEIYEDRENKLEKPDFIKEIRKLKECYVSSFDNQRLHKWYKLTVIRAFYEAIKFMGYKHEWPEISKSLPSIFQVSKEKMERYCDKDTLVAYQSLFGELWSDKQYPNLFIVGAEMAHILKDYKNKGSKMRLNPLQKEHEEWVEEMVKLHLKNQMGDGIKRTSLSDKEIENIQTVMRFGPQDPHAGYYETDLELLEKIENSTPSERRKLLSYESYIEIIKNPKTRKKRFFTTLNMLNVMIGTHDFDEQTRNISVIRDLIIPKKG